MVSLGADGMLAAYIISAVVGGVLVVLGAIGGDAEGGADAGAGPDGDVDHDAGNADHDADVWIPFLSLRFWTFLAAFFGITGLALTLLSPLSAVTVAALSGGVGAGAGLSMSYLTRAMKRGQISSGADERDLVGAEGRVLVAIGQGEAGKIRCRIKGDVVDLLALSDGGGAIAAGQNVVIVGTEGDRVRVLPADKLLEEGK